MGAAVFPRWLWGALLAWAVALILRPDWCFAAFRYATAPIYALALLLGAR